MTQIAAIGHVSRRRHLLDQLSGEIGGARDPQALRQLAADRVRQALGVSQIALLEPCEEGRLAVVALSSEGALPPPAARHRPEAWPSPAGEPSSALWVDWSINGRVAAAMLVRTLSPRIWDDETIGHLRATIERLWFALERIAAEARLRAMQERQSHILRLSDRLRALTDPDAVAGATLDFLGPLAGAIQLGFLSDHPRPRLAAERTHNPHADPLPPEALQALADHVVALPEPSGIVTRALPELPGIGPREGMRLTLVPAWAGTRRCGVFFFLHRADAARLAEIEPLLRDTADRAADAMLRARDGLELSERARAQRETERRLVTLIESLPQLVWRATSDGQWRWSSPQWTEYTGLSPEQSLGHGWLEAVHPDDREAARSPWTRAMREDGMLVMDARIFSAAEGRYRWFQSRIRALPADGGDEGEWLGTFTEIDELMRLRDQQQVLVSELQHRTRNLLGVVRSISRQLMDSSEDMTGFRDRFEDRLNAIARVLGLLSRTDSTEVRLEDLLGMELGAVGMRDAPNVVLSGPKVVLPGRAVQILALAIHELATNALKYGALSMPGGKLSVSWRHDGRAKDMPLFIEWIEVCPTGVGRVETTRRGYGRELIESALPYQLSAETSFIITGSGVRCTISLPLA